jgi:hypothetical protein
VRALGGSAVTAAQLRRFAVGSAANFLVESTGRTRTYRLFHQALADALTAGRGRRIADPAQDEAALTHAFLTHGRQVGWPHAPEYLWRSLPGHATRASLVDDLLTDPGYLLRADLHRVVGASDNARTAAGARAGQLLRRTPQAIPADPAERLALLTVTEALDNAGTLFG